MTGSPGTVPPGVVVSLARPAGPLGLDDDELSACVQCGLCLPHCPTFRVTGDELRSPRGRIAAMRAVERDGAPIDDAFVAAIDTCVQCRGCEPACPSGVPYGHLVEATREVLAADGRITPRWRRPGYRILGHHRVLLAASTVLALAQRLGVVPSARLGLPARLPVRRPALRSSGDDVVIFTGCVMDAWQRDVHLAAAAIVESTGRGVRFSGAAAACCGALAHHAGLVDEARRRARQVVAALDGDAPILVDSAGCGAALRDVGRLLGTPEAEAVAARVLDVHEWIADHVAELPTPTGGHRPHLAVHDPCHLRHVQRAHLSVRAALAPVADLVELDDDGLCCGAGGAWSVEHPAMAADIRARKLAAIARSGATTVVSANPGCTLHLAAAGVDVRHPVEVLAEQLGVRGGR
ncbi:MAG TPA: (Fe-S)-binding protein [Acidimicrobiales bacterium]|nr:(Fe-S)-binding protein [Acidimicrobiales bacterium]